MELALVGGALRDYLAAVGELPAEALVNSVNLRQTAQGQAGVRPIRALAKRPQRSYYWSTGDSWSSAYGHLLESVIAKMAARRIGILWLRGIMDSGMSNHCPRRMKPTRGVALSPEICALEVRPGYAVALLAKDPDHG